MKTKSTAAGSPVSDFDELTGDPFAPRGEPLHDRPELSAVNDDWDKMNHALDGLAFDVGVGPVRVTSPESAAHPDVRHQAEREMRDKVLFGPTNGDPFQHGHRMPVRFEDYIVHASDEERTYFTDAATEQSEFADDMLTEYRELYGDKANDLEGLSRAIDQTMSDLKRQGENPARFAREHKREFLSHVELNHSVQAWDTGRTSGIGMGAGGSARGPQAPDTMSDTELHQLMQRSRGIY